VKSFKCPKRALLSDSEYSSESASREEEKERLAREFKVAVLKLRAYCEKLEQGNKF